MSKIAIIGAGIAGIACARKLTAEGHEVMILEKSRGFGGRCATKRWEGCRADHGVQYFTIRDDRFREALRAACGSSLAEVAAPVRDAEGRTIAGEPRWHHAEGNSRIVRDLAQGLDVRFEQTVTSIVPAQGGWNVGGETYAHVISTAPAPQTCRLFAAAPSTQDYIPCLALLLLHAGQPEGLARDCYAIRGAGPDLGWTACENHKQNRAAPGTALFISHASEAFSRAHLESPPEHWAPLLAEQTEAAWGLSPASRLKSLGHRWRFARAGLPAPAQRFQDGLHSCGDGIHGSRLENAWLSGATFEL